MRSCESRSPGPSRSALAPWAPAFAGALSLFHSDRLQAARREPVMLTGTGSPASPVLLRPVPWQGSAMGYRPPCPSPDAPPPSLIDPFDRCAGIDRADH